MNVKHRKLSPAVVAMVRELVSRLADELNVSEVDAVALIGRALARVAGEVLAESVGDELRGLLG